jgi:hypothetical protein
VVEWAAIAVSLVAAGLAGWSIKYTRRSAQAAERAAAAAKRDADAAERSAAAAEQSQRLAEETVRLDRRRYHDEQRPKGLKVIGDQLHNPTSTTYEYRSALWFGRGESVLGDVGRLPALSNVTVTTTDPAYGDATRLELGLDGDCGCGLPDEGLGHWKVVLPVQSPPGVF